jgi:hypothetical protein
MLGLRNERVGGEMVRSRRGKVGGRDDEAASPKRILVQKKDRSSLTYSI